MANGRFSECIGVRPSRLSPHWQTQLLVGTKGHRRACCSPIGLLIRRRLWGVWFGMAVTEFGRIHRIGARAEQSGC